MVLLPPSSNLEVKLPCAPTVDNVSAIKACEAAATESGFHVAARTKRSLVLMPGHRRALMACLAPGTGRVTGAGRDPVIGRGIMAELVASDDGEGLALSVVRPAGVKKSEAFVSALGTQLARLGHHRRRELADAARREEKGSETSRFKSELSAYYYFSKLLHNQEKAPGLAYIQFVESFVDTYNGVSPTAVEQGRPMLECQNAIDRLSRLVQQLVLELDEEARENVVGLQSHLRSSVERCVFTRVGATLWQLYDRKHSAQDAQYAQKALALQDVSDTRLFESLGIRSEFRGAVRALSRFESGEAKALARHDVADNQDTGGSPSCAQQSLATGSTSVPSCSTAAELEDSSGPQVQQIGRLADAILDSSGGFYERAASALTKIQVALLSNSGGGCTPREAIEALEEAQLEMKTCALEASMGQAELCAMDDILPLFIFVLVRSSLAKPFAVARFMNDALTKDEQLESEGRAVVLLESAARHVAYDWDIAEFFAD